MDERLRICLERVKDQVDVLYRAEEKFMTLDAVYEHKLARLIEAVDPSIGSMVAREKRAKATDEFKEFCEAMGFAKGIMNREKRLLDLKMKQFDGEYLTLKVESPLIKRQL